MSHPDVQPEVPMEAPPPTAAGQLPNYWTEREAAAANQVHARRCIHGVPLNVFCDRCEA